MDFNERITDIEKLKKEPNYELLWYKHGNWLIEQVELLQKAKEKNQGEILYAPKLSDEQITKLKEEWAKSEPGKITLEK